MIWQPVNLGGLTSAQQRGLWSSKGQLDLAAPSTTWGPWLRPPWVPITKRQLWEGSRHSCDSSISKKPVTPRLAGGTFGWPLLPISAGCWPHVGSEALGKCDLLFDYILHRLMSRAGFGPCHRAGAKQQSSGASWGIDSLTWFHVGDLVANRLSRLLASHLSPAGTQCPPSTLPLLPWQHYELKILKQDSEPNVLPPSLLPSSLSKVCHTSETPMEKPRRK